VASDEEPPSPAELPPDETAITSKRKSGAAGKKQASAPKEFDPFEEDMDDGTGDATASANKRRRHGTGFTHCFCLLVNAFALARVPVLQLYISGAFIL